MEWVGKDEGGGLSPGGVTIHAGYRPSIMAALRSSTLLIALTYAL